MSLPYDKLNDHFNDETKSKEIQIYFDEFIRTDSCKYADKFAIDKYLIDILQFLFNIKEIETKVVNKKINEGTYSYIYTLYDTKDICKYPVADITLNLLWESYISYLITHPSIYQWINLCKVKNTYCLVGEKAISDLLDYSYKNKSNLKIIIQYIIQIANGIKILHDNDIVHRDLKINNILLFENDIVKISDFGSCVNYTQQLQIDLISTTPCCCPPQTDKYADIINYPKVDIWGLGTILMDLVLNCVSLEEDDIQLFVNNIDDFFTQKNITNKSLIKLIKSLCNVDIEKRPFIDKVIEDLKLFDEYV
jgi:serine/threonine protein kinase